MNREKKSEISPMKLREACMEYLKRTSRNSQEASDANETSSKFIKKSATLEQIISKVDKPKPMKKITKEQLEALRGTKGSYEQSLITIKKDRVPVTERKVRKKRGESSESDDDRLEEIEDRKRSVGGTVNGSLKWKDIQEVQRSVGEIQRKLQKVEDFMDSLSPESRKRRNKLLMSSNFREAPVRAGTLRIQNNYLDKIDIDKIKIIEKFARNLRENELAKNRMIEKMRQEIEELELLEKSKKKPVFTSNVHRTQSLGRGGRHTDRPHYMEVKRPEADEITEENSDRPIESKTSVDSHVFRTHSFKEYDNNFNKKKATLGQPMKQELNTSTETNLFEDPAAKKQAQLQEKQEKEQKESPQKESNPKKKIAKPVYKDEVIPDPPVRQSQEKSHKPSEKAKEKELGVNEKDYAGPMTPAKDKDRGRNQSQPILSSRNNDEGLKTITLIIPKSRRPFHSTERQSSDYDGGVSSDVSRGSQQEQQEQPAQEEKQEVSLASKSQSLSHPDITSFLPKKGKKKNTSQEQDDSTTFERYEGIKVSTEQIEDNARKKVTSKKNKPVKAKPVSEEEDKSL